MTRPCDANEHPAPDSLDFPLASFPQTPKYASDLCFCALHRGNFPFCNRYLAVPYAEDGGDECAVTANMMPGHDASTTIAVTIPSKKRTSKARHGQNVHTDHHGKGKGLPMEHSQTALSPVAEDDELESSLPQPPKHSRRKRHYIEIDDNEDNEDNNNNNNNNTMNAVMIRDHSDNDSVLSNSSKHQDNINIKDGSLDCGAGNHNSGSSSSSDDPNDISPSIAQSPPPGKRRKRTPTVQTTIDDHLTTIGSDATLPPGVTPHPMEYEVPGPRPHANPPPIPPIGSSIAPSIFPVVMPSSRPPSVRPGSMPPPSKPPQRGPTPRSISNPTRPGDTEPTTIEPQGTAARPSKVWGDGREMVAWASKWLLKYNENVAACNDATKPPIWIKNAVNKMVAGYMVSPPRIWVSFDDIVSTVRGFCEMQASTPLDCTLDGVGLWSMCICELLRLDEALLPLVQQDVDDFMDAVTELGLNLVDLHELRVALDQFVLPIVTTVPDSDDALFTT
jgi:hypothetical protein